MAYSRHCVVLWVKRQARAARIKLLEHVNYTVNNTGSNLWCVFWPRSIFIELLSCDSGGTNMYLEDLKSYVRFGTHGKKHTQKLSHKSGRHPGPIPDTDGRESCRRRNLPLSRVYVWQRTGLKGRGLQVSLSSVGAEYGEKGVSSMKRKAGLHGDEGQGRALGQEIWHHHFRSTTLDPPHLRNGP